MAPPTATTTVAAFRHGGDEDLEIVGEAHYQGALWAICGGVKGGDRIRCAIVAVLVPEPDNPYDPNAIAVQINGNLVGYLARDVAAKYLPGLHAAMGRCGGYVALDGVIVGGGLYDDGPGRLGVWLEHDPADFGLAPVDTRRPAGSGARQAQVTGTMRTGFSEAWLTDLEDDSYDLSWFNDLPDGDRPAIAMLRELLSTDPDPIDRHFQFAELESRLYRCRDLYATALEEFDEACRVHDAEMDTICQAFVGKWKKVPLLETYRQMAIRQQKARDWNAVVWWAERGLALYGNNATREDAVEDLLKRRNRALAKLEPSTSPPKRRAGQASIPATLAETSDHSPPPTARITTETEVLVCSRCGDSYERLRVRGRKPVLCPACRSTA
ncbi:MAG: hypothetical protein QOG53_1526 [Frankiales bacterium]|jgi:hypothetical protein|nr:hypothetical protein [Frankiales bacterium]